MPLIDPSHPLGHLLQRDRRYKLDAYMFVLEALSYAQETLNLGEEPPRRIWRPGPWNRRCRPAPGRESRNVALPNGT